MSFRNTIVLALLVAALGAYLYWVERPAAERESQTTRILEFDPEDVERLELTAYGQTIEARKTDDTWRITAPVEGPADSRAVDTLVQTAAQAERKRTIVESTDDLGAFGLAEPDAVLTIFVDDRPLPALAVGMGTPIGFNAYVRRADEDAVLLTGGTVRAALMKRLPDLRDKTVLHFAESDVARLRITPRDGDDVILEREGEGWRIVAPVDARASQATVDNLFGSLRALRAVEFVTETGADAEAGRGLTPPAFELELSGSSEPVVLRIGDEIDLGDKQLVAATVAGEPQIYLVASHIPASLGKSAADLRDRTLVWTEPGSVTEIRVRHRDGETFTARTEGDAWTLAEGDDTTDPLLVKRFADDVLALSGDTVASEENDLSEFGLDDPDVELTLTDAEGSDLGTIVVRRTTTDDRAIHHGAARGGPVYTLRDYAYTRVAKRARDLAAAPAPAAPSEE